MTAPVLLPNTKLSPCRKVDTPALRHTLASPCSAVQFLKVPLSRRNRATLFSVPSSRVPSARGQWYGCYWISGRSSRSGIGGRTCPPRCHRREVPPRRCRYTGARPVPGTVHRHEPPRLERRYVCRSPVPVKQVQPHAGTDPHPFRSLLQYGGDGARDRVQAYCAVMGIETFEIVAAPCPYTSSGIFSDVIDILVWTPSAAKEGESIPPSRFSFRSCTGPKRTRRRR